MKYKLTDETIKYLGRTLYRIEAIRTFRNVKIGDKGGFIESEKNLSQKGNCWAFDNAKVLEDAVVSDGACIYNKAVVRANAKVFDNAIVRDNSVVCGEACVRDNSFIYDNAEVSGYAYVDGESRIHGDVFIQDHVIIENSHVFGYLEICGRTTIRNAEVSKIDDYIVFKNWWSNGIHFTWTKSNNMWNVGCFYGTGEELIAEAYKDSERSGIEYERIVKYVESIFNK